MEIIGYIKWVWNGADFSIRSFILLCITLSIFIITLITISSLSGAAITVYAFFYIAAWILLSVLSYLLISSIIEYRAYKDREAKEIMYRLMHENRP
jgi:hypothetical protein